MSFFHASLKTFTRCHGKTAIAAAAYRAGSCLADDRTGLVSDYSRRKGVEHTAIFAPPDAPDWTYNISRLWNAAEAAETRSNARTARELLVALPADLALDQRIALTADLSRFLVDRYGLAVMAALHAPDAKGDQRNFHAHLLFTTRAITADGFGPKVRVLDDRKTGPLEVELIRGRVAEIINEHLNLAGLTDRVDHRTLNAQARAAEQRGDIVSAVLLTREPTIREARTTVENRRRGKDDVGSAWNDSVRADNAQALADFLARAQTEGRVIATPTRSDLAQAKTDRARETTNETNETPTAVRASTSTSRIPRVRSSGGRGVRHKLATRSGAATRAEGKDAALLNAAAAQASEVRRTEGEMSQKYVDMIQGIVEEFGQRASNAVAYSRMLQWPFVDVRALSQHTARDPSCGPLLGQAIQADAVWRRAQTLAARRRERYGTAMVATVRERQAVDRLDLSTEPPRWKKRTRREWAEFRRRQRAGLERAQRRERRAQTLVTEPAMRRYADKARSAREVLDQVERKRRTRYPVPGDAMRMGVTAQSSVAPKQLIKAPMPVPSLPTPWMRPTGNEPRRPRRGP